MRQMSEAQWQWIIARYREGYSKKAICLFLGMHRTTLFRILQRRGVIPEAQDALEPLEERRNEFEALGARPKKNTTPPGNKFRYY